MSAGLHSSRERKINMKKENKTRFLAQFAILLALEVIFCFTPLGSIPVGPVVASLGMIPVIITAFALGTKAGALMGGIAGLFSFIIMSFLTPNPLTAFMFTPLYPPGNGWSLVICFVPRIMVGVTAGLAYKLFSKKSNNSWLCYGVSGVLGSMANSVLVLGGTFLAFGKVFESATNIPVLPFIGTVLLTNAIPEAVVSFFVSFAVGKAIKRAGVNKNA